VNLLPKYGLVLFVATIGVTGQILLKKGLRSFSALAFDSFLLKIVSIIFQPVILLALFCYGIGVIAYLFLLSKVELTAVYPVCTSLTFGGITFFGWFVLNEALSWQKILAIGFIVIGILLLERFG
jgi:multidrug transporter EmrE-like cation transporter